MRIITIAELQEGMELWTTGKVIEDVAAASEPGYVNVWIDGQRYHVKASNKVQVT